MFTYILSYSRKLFELKYQNSTNLCPWVVFRGFPGIFFTMFMGTLTCTGTFLMFTDAFLGSWADLFGKVHDQEQYVQGHFSQDLHGLFLIAHGKLGNGIYNYSPKIKPPASHRKWHYFFNLGNVIYNYSPMAYVKLNVLNCREKKECYCTNFGS